MFASPGSDAGEVGKFIKTISKGAALFVNKYIKNEKMTQENFAIVVSIPKSKLASTSWDYLPCNCEVVNCS
jgi:hypothetical protein